MQYKPGFKTKQENRITKPVISTIDRDPRLDVCKKCGCNVVPAWGCINCKLDRKPTFLERLFGRDSL